jgi:ADP-ribose pyrophosphatase YjhB (NUDIX family)
MSRDGIMVGVGTLIVDDDRLLVARHVPEKRSFWEGRWIMPGGRIKYGEGLEECAIRETKEETNLDVRVVRHISTMDTIVSDGPWAGLHVIYIDFLAEVVGGELTPGSDVGEARWMSRAEVLENIGDFHPDTVMILENVGWLGEGMG